MKVVFLPIVHNLNDFIDLLSQTMLRTFKQNVTHIEKKFNNIAQGKKGEGKLRLIVTKQNGNKQPYLIASITFLSALLVEDKQGQSTTSCMATRFFKQYVNK